MIEHEAIVRAAMADPRAYEGVPDDVEIAETHCSWVFLAGGRAYKVKKPVVLPFLDYGRAREARPSSSQGGSPRRLDPAVDVV